MASYFSLLLTKDLYVLHLFDIMLNCAAKKNVLNYNIQRFYFFPYFELENSVINYLKNSNELYRIIFLKIKYPELLGFFSEL